MTTDQSNRNLEEEIAVLREEMRDLESSIQQNLSVLHSTPRARGAEICDSGIGNDRQVTVTPRSRLADHFSETKHDERFMGNGARPKVGYHGVQDETEYDGDGYVGKDRVDTQFVSHRRPRPVTQIQEPVVRKFNRREIKAATYDGSTSWIDYRTHFQTVAKLNEWTEEEKGLFLAASLRGHAQAVPGDLPGDNTEYQYLVKALEERFAPPNQTELYRVQLRERRKRASETMPELGHSIRRSVNLAYP